jgi:hypothetical protein
MTSERRNIKFRFNISTERSQSKVMQNFTNVHLSGTIPPDSRVNLDVEIDKKRTNYGEDTNWKN